MLRRREVPSIHHSLLYCSRERIHPSLQEAEALAAAEADARDAAAQAAQAALAAEALRLQERAMATGTFHSTEGYDDAEFQQATKLKCEKDFFSDFQLFVPSVETKVGQEWTVHCLFDFQQESAEHGILSVGSHRRMCSAPSHLFHADDGPIAILHETDEVFLEIVLQVATQCHYPTSISNVRLGAPVLADGYPRDLADRRRVFASMMEQKQHLLQMVSERPGANEAQLKVLLRLPALLSLTSRSASEDVANPKCTLLALGFDVRFEGYLVAFSFRALLSAKVVGTLSHAQSDALAKQLKSYPTILPKSSYRCSTDEPPVFARGVLQVHVRSARSLPKADHVPGRSSDPYCVISVVHRSKAGSSQRTAVKPRTVDPVWDEHFRFDVLDANRDLLRIDVFDENKVTKDVQLAWLEVAVADVAGEIDLPESADEGTWTLTPAPPFFAPSHIQLKLSWTKTLMPERDAHAAIVAAEIDAARKQAAASRAAEVAARMAAHGLAAAPGLSEPVGREA